MVIVAPMAQSVPTTGSASPVPSSVRPGLGQPSLPLLSSVQAFHTPMITNRTTMHTLDFSMRSTRSRADSSPELLDSSPRMQAAAPPFHHMMGAVVGAERTISVGRRQRGSTEPVAVNPLIVDRSRISAPISGLVSNTKGCLTSDCGTSHEVVKDVEVGLSDRVLVVECQIARLEQCLAAGEFTKDVREPKLTNSDDLFGRLTNLEFDVTSRLQALETRGGMDMTCGADKLYQTLAKGGTRAPTDTSANSLISCESSTTESLAEMECDVTAVIQSSETSHEDRIRLESDIIARLSQVAKAMEIMSASSRLGEAIEARLAKVEKDVEVNSMMASEVSAIHVDVCSCECRVGQLEHDVTGAASSLQRMQLGFVSLVTAVRGSILPEPSMDCFLESEWSGGRSSQDASFHDDVSSSSGSVRKRVSFVSGA